MRFTVYAEDLRPDRKPEVITTKVRDDQGVTYKGVRIFLGPDNVHRVRGDDVDDDTSAINLFVPRDRDGKPVTQLVRVVLADVMAALDRIDREA
jgi:hypothetical protein